jgi:formylglycine-generating enzyme required for sulfatase activity
LFVSCKQDESEETSSKSSTVAPIASKDIVPAKMILIPSGTFEMGTNDPAFPDAQPIHKVSVKEFWMDEHEVTNAEFEKFVRATNYVTVAERSLDPKDFPGVPVESLVPGSGVFSPPGQPVSLDNALQWWKYVPGASWRHPSGPGSNIIGQENNPAVHISYEDAIAYAEWAVAYRG